MGWAKKAAAEMGMFGDTSSDDELNLGYNGAGRYECPSYSEDETNNKGGPAHLGNMPANRSSDLQSGMIQSEGQCSPYDEDDFEKGEELCSTVEDLHKAIQLDFDELIQEVACSSEGCDYRWMPNDSHPPTKTETEEVRKIEKLSLPASILLAE